MGLLSKSIAVYVTSTGLFRELEQTAGSVAGCCVTWLQEGGEAKKDPGCCRQVFMVHKPPLTHSPIL